MSSGSLVAVALVSLVGAACPDDPAFVSSDVTSGVGDTTADGEVADEVDATPPGTPCERDCVVKVSDEEAEAFDAIVDPSGRATVAAFRNPGPGQYHLVVRRFDGASAWPLETLSGSVVEPVQIVVVDDPAGELHVLAEVGFGLTGSTSWYRRAEGGTWSHEALTPGRRCIGARVRRGPIPHVACLDADDLEIVILRLESASEELAWSQSFVLPEAGWLSRIGFTTSLPWGFDVDVLAQPHVAWSCCGPDSPLRYAWWDGRQWRETELAAPTFAAGTFRRTARLGLDPAGHPHVIHQQDVDGHGELVDRVFIGAWGSSVLARADNVGSPIGELLELVPDSRRRLHVVYQLDTLLVYRVYDAGWSQGVTSTVPVDGSSRHVALTIADETPHVVFADPDGAVWWWTPAEPPAAPR